MGAKLASRRWKMMEWYEEEAVQEPSDNKSDVAAVLAAVRVSVNLFCSVYQLRSGNHI